MAPPLGTLKIQVVEAQNLYVKDPDGKDNAFCKIKVGDQKERTRVIKDSNSPLWDEEFAFAVKKLDESVKVELFHHSKGSKDAFLGQYKFNVREVAERGEVDSWFTLQKRSKSSKVKGKVHLRLTWDGYQVPTDLFIFVREARNLSSMLAAGKKAQPVSVIRFGDYESRTQPAQGTNPKWEETMQFPWDEKAKDILFEIHDENEEKVASVKIQTKSIDEVARKGQWYELKPSGKKSSSSASPPEVFLRLGFDDGVSGDDSSSTKKKNNKKKRSSAAMEPATDLIGQAEELEELPDMSEAGSGSDESEKSDIEDSLSSSGHFKKKPKGFLDRFKAASEQGKILLTDVEAKIGGAAAKGIQYVVEFVFEKQNVITEPKGTNAPKWKDSDFMFAIKEFTSELKVKLWEIPAGTKVNDIVLATENPANLIGTGVTTLEALERAAKLKDTFTIDISKLKKQSYSGSSVKLSVQFLPVTILDEEDFEPEHVPPDLEDSDPLGKLKLEVLGGRNFLIREGKTTCDLYFTCDCQGETYSSAPIADSTTPEWHEDWTCDVKTLENSRLLICVWDRDSKGAKDELVGAIKFPLHELADGKEVLKWFNLGRKPKMATVSGDIQVKLQYSGKGIKRKDSFRRRGNSSASKSGAESDAEGSGSKKSSSKLGRRRTSGDDEAGGSEDASDAKELVDVEDDEEEEENEEEEEEEEPEDVMGHVTITIAEARDLRKAGSKMDTYAIVRLSEHKHKTKVIKGTPAPRWDDQVKFPVTDLLSDIEVSVWEVEKSGDQKFLGKATVGCETLAESSAEKDQWLNLTGGDAKKGKEKSPPQIRLVLQFKKRIFKPKKAVPLFSKKSEIHDEDIRPDLLFKIILLGESGVGKTNLFTRIIHNKFEDGTKATLGVEFATKTYKVEGKVVRAQLSDTAGQERFRSVSRQYYRGAMAGILVYDITSMNSFSRIQSWIEEIRENSNNPLLHLLLLGNKLDLEEELREVPTDKAMELAKKYDMLFMECSAKDSTNVGKAFQEILTAIYEQARTTGIQKISDNPYTVMDPSEELDIVKLEGGKTIVISAEDAHYGEGVVPAGAGGCKC